MTVCRMLALAILGVSLTGCGALRRSTATAPSAEAPAAPATTTAQTAPDANALAEVRARALSEPSEAYWPYREAVLVLGDATQPKPSDVAQARAALEASLARDPGYPAALALLSRLDFAAGRHAEAIARLEPYRVTLPGVSEEERKALLEGLALHYDAIGRTDLAAQTTSEIGAPSGDSHASTRVYLVLRGDSPDQATDPATRALKQGKESAVNRNNFGITRLRAGDVEGALESFTRAIELDPALPGPYYNLALLERHYRFDERAAARWLALYRERSNDDPDGLFGDGRE